MTELEKYYNKFNEDKRLKSRHGQVEFAVTTHYILDFIAYLQEKTGKKALDIIDIGAGTGAYSAFLSERGHNVTAVELVKKNASQIAIKNKAIKVKVGNALDLKVGDEQFDIALVFGPLYHLFSHEEKLRALIEAKRVVRRGGVVMAVFLMNDYAVIRYAFCEGNLKKCLAENKLDEAFNCLTCKDDLYSYVRTDEINMLKNEANLTRAKLIGVDGATDYIRPVLNSLDEHDFNEFIRYQLSIAEHADLVGASSHCLDILIKN